MKVIELKKLPDFDWTSPIETLSDEELEKWADGRQVYYVALMDKYIVEVKE